MRTTEVRTPAPGPDAAEERPRAPERRRRRPPAALVALLLATTLLGLAWTVLVPAFNAPDENSHFAFVQDLGERFALPGDPKRPPWSTAQAGAAAALNADQTAGQVAVRPEWSRAIERRWETTQATLPRDNGGGPTPAGSNPPASYLWATLGYVAAKGGTTFDQLFAARLMCLLWLPVTVLAVWLLAGELFDRRRSAQLAAAAVPALVPMVVFISSSLTTDSMLYATWSLALWLGVRILRRGATPWQLAALAAVVGVACTVKATSFALIPGFLFVVAMAAKRARSRRPAALLRSALVVGIPLLLTIGAWYAVARFSDRGAAPQLADATSGTAGTNWREFISYLWQFYLPKLPFMDAYSFSAPGRPLFQVWMKQAWGAFGWLEIRFPVNVYRVLAVLTGLVGLAALARLWQLRRRIDVPVAVYLVLVTAALLAGVHWTDYHMIASKTLGFMQGRYLFPVIGVAGLALAAAIDRLPARLRGPALGGSVAFLAGYHVLALGLVLERFYA